MKKYKLLLLLIIVIIGGFLRFYQIQKYPPGLYIDEASTGYNAYTILSTGQDEYGASFPLFFRAFGEYKTPVYIYSTAASMAIFGKNEFAIRFPSALTGTLTLAVFYMFLSKLLEGVMGKHSFPIKKYMPILATLLLSISSWHIHFSRGGFEVTYAIFLYLLGSYMVLQFWDKKNSYYLLSGIIFYLFTMYTYFAFRIIAPVTCMVLLLVFLKMLPKLRKQVIIAGIVFALFSLPLFLFSITSEGLSRFSQTSTFVEYKADTPTQKLFTYPMVFLKNYLSFFSFDFLVGYGDGNGRHQIPGFGLIYRWQLPFLLVGMVWVLMQKKSILKFTIIGLLLVVPTAGAIARPSPHALRSLLLVLPVITLVSLGIVLTISNIKQIKKAIILVIVAIAIYESIIYLHYYYFHYPSVNALDWGSGNKTMVEKAGKYRNSYDYLVVDKNLNFAQIYFSFYDDSLKPQFVDVSWEKPDNWKNKRVLYIRPFYGDRQNVKVVDTAYLPGPNKDIYAQFWKL